MKNLAAAVLLLSIVVIGCSDTPQPTSPTAQTQPNQLSLAKGEVQGVIPNAYIVVISSKLPEKNAPIVNAELRELIASMQKQYRFEVSALYDACLTGFAATMDAATAERLARDPRVEMVDPDRIAVAFAQTLPTGINRVDADISSTLAGNGSGTVTGVDAYIIDTGIMTTHADLNVKGGINYAGGASTAYGDGNGHGTHVAGTVAAKDNTSYVVGVAPGADLYAVRVLGNNGSGSYSQILSGVNWVTARKNANPTRPMVANMSLGGYTGSTTYNSLDLGVKNSITKGVFYAIAAGNSSADAKYYSPAHVTEATTVGAYSPTTNAWASFSNKGTIVDILAPGVNILSTSKSGGTTTMSGTSMSSPHVAGIAALYLSANPSASPAAVLTAMKNAAAAPVGSNPTITGVPSGTTTTSAYAGNF